MYIVYILQSKKDLRTYTGHTSNLNQRLAEHNNGKVEATKHRRPFELLHSEECRNELEAKQREQYWKTGAGRKNLKRLYQGFSPRFSKRGEARSS